MKAVGYYRSLPIDQDEALIDLEIAKPAPGGRDLLVKIEAVSVNPVDVKTRMRAAGAEGKPKILGYDGAGTVAEIGPDCCLFKPGDTVFYAGSNIRQGTNQEFHLVGERIVGTMPKSLSFAQAAALPLTSITAWEMLFDRLEIRIGKTANAGAILIIGGAGGVGSIAIQLARRLTGLTVVTTASRPETVSWCRELGVHHVIDHRQPFAPQLAAAGIAAVDLVLGLTATDQHLAQIAEVIAPQGRFGLIDDPKALDISVFKRKSVSVHWESMFTRSIYQTPDMIEQHNLLDEVSRLVDEGVLRTTLGENLGRINAANLKRAHALVESGKARGKLVLEGF